MEAHMGGDVAGIAWDQEQLNEHNLKECKWLNLDVTCIVELLTTYPTSLVRLDLTDTGGPIVYIVFDSTADIIS